MTIGCIGDIHLGALDRHIPKAYKKVLRTVDRMVENCVSKGIEHIVLLGDVSDTTRMTDHMFIEFCDLLRKYDVEWHVLVGNHDRASEDSHSLSILHWLGKSGLLNVRVYNSPEIVKIDGDRYFMCPSPYVEDVPKKCRYGFGHFGFSGALSDSGISIRSSNTPSGRWVLGDYHTPQTGRTYQYAGSVTQTKFAELPDKGYIELEDRPKFVSWKPSILLDRKTLANQEDLTSLDKRVYYAVSLTKDMVMPANWASQYPNIIKLSAEKHVSKKARVLLKSISKADALSGLDTWLMNKGLTDKEIALAHKLLR